VGSLLSGHNVNLTYRNL